MVSLSLPFFRVFVTIVKTGNFEPKKTGFLELKKGSVREIGADYLQSVYKKMLVIFF